MTMYETLVLTLVYQFIAAVFFTKPVTAKEVTICNITVITFRHKSFFANATIIVFPSLECFWKMTQEEDQEKAGFYLEDEYNCLCSNNNGICSFGTPKVF